MSLLVSFQRFAKKWGRDGIRSSLERKRRRQFEKNQINIEAAVSAEATEIQRDGIVECTPLNVYYIPTPVNKRLSIITDSINSGSLFGGVGTALILAGLVCRRTGWDLRIITRTEAPDKNGFRELFRIYEINLNCEVQFVFSNRLGQGQLVDVFDEEIFVTTSWWTTDSIKNVIRPRSIFYLLQEDERMFYPAGDLQLRCLDMMRRKDIRFLVNTKLLLDHFDYSGLSNIKNNGVFFEPAFPESVYKPNKLTTGRRRFMFYARPNNPRNLYLLGLEVVNTLARNEAIPADWEIVFVGRDIDCNELNNGRSVTVLQNMPWSEYADLAGTIDVALSLMYTPHPSYPPLDLAASGAIVVTNKFMNKQDLSGYSENILISEATVEHLVDAAARAINLSRDGEQRYKNWGDNKIRRSWSEALDVAIKHVVGETYAAQ